MAHLSQVWQRLRTYVICWLEPNQNFPIDKATSRLIKNRSNFNSTGAIPTVNMVLESQDNNLELPEKNLNELLAIEKLYQSLLELAKPDDCVTGLVDDKEFEEKIYNLFGEEALKPEIVFSIMDRLVTSNKTCLISIFERLKNFYHRWSQGEFIDAVPSRNWPQKKMLEMHLKNLQVGIRQVDIYTGLNVMILLLELHRYGQKQDEFKQKIIFYPSGQPDTENFFTSQLLRAINYSDAIEIGNFSSIVGEFLKGGNFSGAYLGSANLTGVNFSNANLKGTYFGDANLTGACLCDANLGAANLGDANLSGANLNAANLRRTDLSSANLSGANLDDADFGGANLSNADLSSSNFDSADFTGANLTGANLRNANLKNANLKYAILFGANLSDANLSNTNLTHADLCRADISGVDLSDAILEGANLSDTILFSANLNNSILHAADLSYAKLSGAKLQGADLQGATLLGADLNGVDLSNVILSEADLSGVTLSEANLSCANLTDAILSGSDLSYANLNSANLSGSNLTGANLGGADLSGTDLSYAILGGVDLSQANLDAIAWNENQAWSEVRGLETALNVPAALKEKLGLGRGSGE
jgi:uncharacterized protein YjbI with pentapeptide repeats